MRTDAEATKRPSDAASIEEVEDTKPGACLGFSRCSIAIGAGTALIVIIGVILAAVFISSSDDAE